MDSESLAGTADWHTTHGTPKSIQRKEKNKTHLEGKDQWQGAKKDSEMRQREVSLNSQIRAEVKVREQWLEVRPWKTNKNAGSWYRKKQTSNRLPDSAKFFQLCCFWPARRCLPVKGQQGREHDLGEICRMICSRSRVEARNIVQGSRTDLEQNSASSLQASQVMIHLPVSLLSNMFLLEPAFRKFNCFIYFANMV